MAEEETSATEVLSALDFDVPCLVQPKHGESSMHGGKDEFGAYYIKAICPKCGHTEDFISCARFKEFMFSDGEGILISCMVCITMVPIKEWMNIVGEV